MDASYAKSEFLKIGIFLCGELDSHSRPPPDGQIGHDKQIGEQLGISAEVQKSDTQFRRNCINLMPLQGVAK